MSEAFSTRRSKLFQESKDFSPFPTGPRVSFALKWLTLMCVIAMMISTALTGCGNGGSTTDYWGGGSDTSPITSLAIDPATATIPVGQGSRLTAMATFSDGSTYDATSSVTWSSSDESVVTVNQAGIFTTKGAGQATITAASGTLSARSSITVTNAALKSIAVSPQAPTVPVGRHLQLTAMGTFDDGSVFDLSNTVTWASSKTTTATVDSKGIVTVTGQGTATITASMNDISGTTAITASTATLVSINVDPDNPTLRIGDKLQFKAIGTFSDGTAHDLTATLTWTTSDGRVAFISEDGLCTARALGNTTITATDLDSPKITGTSTLTVSTSAVKSIAVTPATYTLPAGRNIQLTAIATYDDGKTDDVTATATWNSSNTGAVTVDNKGLVTAPAAGTGSSTVNATLGGKSGSSTITVNSGVTLVSLLVSPTNPTIQVGQTQQFTASGKFSDGSTHDVTADCTWKSSDTRVGTVSSKGLATGVAKGNTDITARDGAISDESTLTVTDASKLISITVTPNPATASFGQTMQFTAKGTYENKSTRDLTKEVTWASSDHAIADFSDDPGGEGKATAKNQAGSTDITATSKDRTITSMAVRLTVSGDKGAPLSIAVYSTDNSVTTGNSLQYKAAGYYTDHTVRDISSEVTWTSSDKTVATIDDKGNAKGVSSASAATAVISATSKEGGSIVGVITLVVNPVASSGSKDISINNKSGIPDEAVFLTQWGQAPDGTFYYNPFARTATTVEFFTNQQTVGNQYSYPLVGLRKTGDHTYTYPCPAGNMQQSRLNVSITAPLPVGPGTLATNMVQPDIDVVKVPFDFFEPDMEGTQIFFDTSNVDWFSLGLQASWTVQGTTVVMGFEENGRENVIKAFTADPVFSQCMEKTGSTTIRVRAPYHVQNPTSELTGWLGSGTKDAIASAWTFYGGPDNKNVAMGGWSSGEFTYVAAPTGPAGTINVIGRDNYGQGPATTINFAQPANSIAVFQQQLTGATPVENRFQALIFSSLCRGVCEDYLSWGDPTPPQYGYPSKYYQSTTLHYNNYAEILHQHSLNVTLPQTGPNPVPACYAFPGDDEYKQDSSSGSYDFSSIDKITVTIPPFDFSK